MTLIATVSRVAGRACYDAPPARRMAGDPEWQRGERVSTPGLLLMGVDGREFELTSHAAVQLRRRGISVRRVEEVLRNPTRVFQYYHDLEVKTGYYHRRMAILVATMGGRITTVIGDVSPDYIRRLRGLRP
jgi:hypothetical protein